MKSIFKILLPVVLLLVSSNDIFAVTRYWVGPSGGNYSTASNWNTASNGSGSPGAPTSSDNIVINRTVTIVIDGNYYPASLLITGSAGVEFTTTVSRTMTIGGGTVSPAFKVEVNSQLKLTGTAGITLMMAGTSQCEIYGTLDFFGTNSKMDYASGGKTTIKSGAVIRYGGTSSNGTGSVTTFFMENQSTYEVYKDGGVFPTGTYAPESQVLNSGAITTPAMFLMNSTVGSYGIYTFDCSSFTGTSSAMNSNLRFNDFFIFSTGTGRWVFSSSPSATYNLIIDGDFSISPGAEFDFNRALSGSQPTVLKILGNVIIDGTITETGSNTGSVIELAGSDDSYFYSVPSGIQNDISMTINKAVGSSVIATDSIFLPASANAKLNLTSGILNTGDYSVMVVIKNPAPGALTGGSLNSHIVGSLKRFTNQAVDYSFPVSNTLDQLARAVIRPASAAATQWNVTFLSPNPNNYTGLTPGQIDVVTDYYWDIIRTGSTPANASNITLYYGELIDSGINIMIQPNMVYFNGTSWVNYGSVMGSGSITNALGTNGSAAPANPITAFGSFAIGGRSNLVPVNVEYFTGRRSGLRHELFWKVNCASSPYLNMSLQRRGDAGNFADIYSENADAARCLQSFSFTDVIPLPGKNFYRMAFRDADGRISYSTTLLLVQPDVRALAVSVFPNPAAGPAATLEIRAAEAAETEIVITDLLGRILKRRQVSVLPGSNRILLDLEGLPAAQYRISLTDSRGHKSTIPLLRKIQ